MGKALIGIASTFEWFTGVARNFDWEGLESEKIFVTLFDEIFGDVMVMTS